MLTTYCKATVTFYVFVFITHAICNILFASKADCVTYSFLYPVIFGFNLCNNFFSRIAYGSIFIMCYIIFCICVIWFMFWIFTPNTSKSSISDDDTNDYNNDPDTDSDNFDSDDENNYIHNLRPQQKCNRTHYD